MRPVIALLTDFGLRDHYVGSLKAVLLGICPDASLVDITHDVPPQDVLAGALELCACYRDFPPGTVFLAVVDPGVGSGRRPLAAEAGGYRFVAPDNGLLAPVFDEAPPALLVQLATSRYAASSVSRTFEGRDRFAPAAAWLATGVAMRDLGPEVSDPVALAVPRAAVRGGTIEGEVLTVDRFGNLVTNIPAALLGAVAGADLAGLDVRIAGREAGPLVATYSEVVHGETCALVGSTGRLEVSVNGGSAATRFGAGRGARVTVGTEGAGGRSQESGVGSPESGDA